MGARTRSLLPLWVGAIGVIGAIVAFRAEAVPFAAAVAIAAGVVIAALVAGARQEGAARSTAASEAASGSVRGMATHGSARGTAALLFLVAGATSLAGLSDSLWPCDVACRGQEEWATLLRVPTLVWCGGATLLAALLLAVARAPDASAGKAAPGELLAFGCAGASLWFVALALERGVACRHCFAVHLPIFAAAALLACGALRPAWLRVATIAVGALLTRQLFAYDLARSGPPVVAPTTTEPVAGTGAGAGTGTGAGDVEGNGNGAKPEVESAADRELAAAIDRGRTQGGATPKLRVELHVSFNCGHCAEEFEPLLDALRPHCDDGEAELVVRLVAVKKEPASRELSKLALAAARDGRFRERIVATFAVRKSAVVDPKQRAPGGMKEAVNRYLARDTLTLEKLKEQPAVAADATFIAAHPALFDRLLAADESAITRLGGTGELPWLFLVDPTTGAVLEKLPEGTTPAALATAVATRLR